MKHKEKSEAMLLILLPISKNEIYIIKSSEMHLEMKRKRGEEAEQQQPNNQRNGP